MLLKHILCAYPATLCVTLHNLCVATCSKDSISDAMKVRQVTKKYYDLNYFN